MKRANFIKGEYFIKKNKYRFNFNIDDKLKSHLSITFPFDISAFDTSFHDYLGTALASLLASIVLAKKVETSFTFRQKDNFLEIIKILYDIRCYSENKDFVKLPKIDSQYSLGEKVSFKTKADNAILFWSGGVDSTLSYLLLRKNEYKTFLVHTDINVDQKKAENVAVRKISKQLGVSSEFIEIDFPMLKKISKLYSNKFDKYPSYNSIPFGRDIVHVFIGLYYSYIKKAKYLCFGHEYELWKNNINVKGNLVYRNDLQSEQASIILNNILKTINKDLRIFSPIASLSKLKAYKLLLEYNQAILKNTESCYFGNKCGECNNCLLYDVLGKVSDGQEGDLKEFVKVILETKNTVSKETFANILYVYFYTVIKEGKNTSEFEKIIQHKFGKVLNKSKKEVLRDLNIIKKIKLTPNNFKYK